MNNYDNYGWYVGDTGEDRSAPIAPTNLSTSSTVGELRSNWTGVSWVELPYSAPAVTDNSAQIKAAKWEEIKAYRENLLLNGGYPSGGHWYHSDLISRSQHQNAARKADAVEAAGGDMTATLLNKNGDPVYVKTMDNGFMAISANTAQNIILDAEVQEMAIYAKALWHREQLEASSDPANYDYTTNWPETFQG